MTIRLIKTPKVYTVILNYQTWSETLQCIDSVLALDYENNNVIVVDNASPNGSMEQLRAWVESRALIGACRRGSEVSAGSGAFRYEILKYQGRGEFQTLQSWQGEADRRFEIIDSGRNGGYAAGNNCGIQRAMQLGDADYIWILNNDVIVDRCSLSRLVDATLDLKSKGRSIGLMGSIILDFESPSKVQAAFGRFNKYSGTSKHIDFSVEFQNQYPTTILLSEIEYPIGAAILVDIAFIKEVGLMCEDYFLFYEEMDWVIRGRRIGWHAGCCGDAVVFHKEGVTTGSKPGARSRLSEFYLLRNRVLFSKKFFKKYIFIIYVRILLSLLKRAMTDINAARVMISAILSAWSYRNG